MPGNLGHIPPPLRASVFPFCGISVPKWPTISLQSPPSATYNHAAIVSESCHHWPSIFPVAHVSPHRGGWACGLDSILRCGGENDSDLGPTHLPNGFPSPFATETHSKLGWEHTLESPVPAPPLNGSVMLHVIVLCPASQNYDLVRSCLRLCLGQHPPHSVVQPVIMIPSDILYSELRMAWEIPAQQEPLTRN